MYSFITEPNKVTLQRGMVGEEYTRVIEPDIAALRKTLEELGITKIRSLLRSPTTNPLAWISTPPGEYCAPGEGLFRGGKGDFTEGGVRVAAAALWPGVIEPGQLAGDMMHEVDLFTTFARLAGATGLRTNWHDGCVSTRRHAQ